MKNIIFNYLVSFSRIKRKVISFKQIHFTKPIQEISGLDSFMALPLISSMNDESLIKLQLVTKTSPISVKLV